MNIKSCCQLFERTPQQPFQIKTNDKIFNKYQRQLDLSKLSSDEITERDFLNKILDQIRNNYSIESIIEDKRFKDLKQTNNFQPLINKIEAALALNIEKYSKYPTDYIYCLLASHVYCLTKQQEQIETNQKIKKSFYSFLNKENEDDIHCSKIWQQLKDNNWMIYEILKLNGYKSIIYINEKSKQIVLAYQGMKFKLEDYFTKKFKKYLNSLANSIHDNFMALFYHIKKCNELINTNNKLEGYSLSFTSYSMGSLLSDLSVLICHKYFNNKDVRSVTFESIGTKQYLNILNAENEIDLDSLDIKTYFYRVSNFVNATNEHIGDLYLLKNNEVNSNEAIVKLTDQNINYHSFYKNGLNSLCSINLKKILICLEKQEYSEKIITWPLVAINNTSEITQFKNKHLVFDYVNPIPDDFIALVKDLATANLDHLKIFFKIANSSNKRSETIISQIKISTTQTERVHLFQRKFQPQQFNTDYYLDLINRMDTETLSGTMLINKYLLNLKSYFRLKNDLIITSFNQYEISLIDTVFKRIETIEPKLKEIIQVYFDSVGVDSSLTFLNNKRELFDIKSKDYLPGFRLDFLKRNKSEIINCFKRNQQYTVVSGDLKSSIAYYYATDIFLQNSNTFAFGIDCSLLRINVLDQFGHFVDDLSPNKLERDTTLVIFLKEILNKTFETVHFLIILDNLTNHQDFMDLTNGFGSNVKFLITSDDETIVSELFYPCYHFHSFRGINSVLVLKYLLKRNDDIYYKPYVELYKTPKKEKEAEFIAILKDDNSCDDLPDVNNILQKYDLKTIVSVLKKGFIASYADFIQLSDDVFEFIKSKFEIIHEYLGYLAFLETRISYNLLKNIFELVKPNNFTFSFCIQFLLAMKILIQNRQNKEEFLINSKFDKELNDLTNIEYETKCNKIGLIFGAFDDSDVRKQLFNKKNVFKLDFKFILTDSICFTLSYLNLNAESLMRILEYGDNYRYSTPYYRYLIDEVKAGLKEINMIKTRRKKVKFESDCKELIFKLNNLRTLLQNFDLYELYQEFRFIAQLNCELAIQDLTQKQDIDQDRITAQLTDLNLKEIDKIDQKEKQYFKFNQKHQANLIKKVNNLRKSIESLMRNWNKDNFFENKKDYLKITKARIRINEIVGGTLRKLNKDIHSFINTRDDTLFKNSVVLNGCFILDLVSLINQNLQVENYLKRDKNLVVFYECDRISNGLYFILLSFYKLANDFISNQAIIYNPIDKIQRAYGIGSGIIESMRVVHDIVYIEFKNCFKVLKLPEFSLLKKIQRVDTFLKGATEASLFLLNFSNELTIFNWELSHYITDDYLQNIIHLILQENNLYTIDQMEIVGQNSGCYPTTRTHGKFYVKASFEQSSFIYVYNLEKVELIKKLEFNFIANDFKFDSDWNLFVRDEKASQMIIYDVNFKKDIKQIMGYEFFKNFFIDQNRIVFYEHV